MKYYAWVMLSLGLLVLTPAGLSAQQQEERAPPDSVALGRNYPNPFNPETTIPFSLEEGRFAGGRRPVVTLKIYNVLAQVVAVPILQGSGEPLENLALEWNGTGQYSAYWDGTYLDSGQVAASGVYVYRLVVDGRVIASKKMTIVK